MRGAAGDDAVSGVAAAAVEYSVVIDLRDGALCEGRRSPSNCSKACAE